MQNHRPETLRRLGSPRCHDTVADRLNQIAGAILEKRLTVIAGKFSLADYFDNNAYSHDPRTQFMNWSLMNSASWDYPADTHGYTWGLVTGSHEPLWSLRIAAAAEPKEANELSMDRRVGRAHGLTIEGEHIGVLERP